MSSSFDFFPLHEMNVKNVLVMMVNDVWKLDNPSLSILTGFSFAIRTRVRPYGWKVDPLKLLEISRLLMLLWLKIKFGSNNFSFSARMFVLELDFRIWVEGADLWNSWHYDNALTCWSFRCFSLCWCRFLRWLSFSCWFSRWFRFWFL